MSKIILSAALAAALSTAAQCASILQADFRLIDDDLSIAVVDDSAVMLGAGSEASFGIGDASILLDLSPDGEVTVTLDLGSLSSSGAPVTWEITSIVFDMAATITGFEASAMNPAGGLGISFGDTSLSMSLADLTNPPQQVYTFGFQAEITGATVPLPAGLTLMLAGLGGLALLRRRRG